MDIRHLAQELKAITKDISEVWLDDLDESYMTLEDVKEVAEIILNLVTEKYYEGWNDKAEYYLNKLNEVNEIIRKYIGAYAL